MEPYTEWTAEQYKRWVQLVKESKNLDRRDLLKEIASGPCGRDDVQAARRLLCKPRYAEKAP